MHKSENTVHSLVALVAGVFLSMLAMLPVIGYLGFGNAHLRRENQELRAGNLHRAYQQVPPVVVNVPRIHVDVTGIHNTVTFDYTTTGGASRDVAVSGVDGASTIYLGAGQTAQVTLHGTGDIVFIASALKGCVSCTDTGVENRVVEKP